MGKAALQNDKPCVLVVDDSRVVRHTIVKALGAHFDMLEAENGVAAWRTLNQNSRIQLVISDIQMPEMDGYTFICKVRAADDPALRDMPVVVITSAEDEITRERAYACGANDFVLKPFNTTQLIQCIDSQLAAADEQQAPAAPHTANGDGEVVLANPTQDNVTRTLILVLRVLPLLKNCNTKLNLGIEREIALVQQRIAAAHEEMKKSEAGDVAG
jgi:CheY-like chemotaxis protein